MINFEKIGSSTHYHAIVINGEKLKSSRVSLAVDKSWSGNVHNPLESKTFFLLTLSDIENSRISFLDLRINEIVDRWLILHSVVLYLQENIADTEHVDLNFLCDLENWTSPFSASAYLRAFREIAKTSSASELKFDFFESEFMRGGSLTCALKNKDVTAQDFIVDNINLIKKLSRVAAEEALRTVRKNSLVTWFNFPAPIKTSCEQYLIYFVQFLEDLGIKANSEIKEDAGRILFSVTPADGPSALGKIKEALESYLDLPRNPEFNAVADDFSDMAVSQLKANVFFLKSQLVLAQAMLEAKDATIEALKLTTYQQRQLLTGSTSGGGTKEDESESEPILGDTVHLTKYEGKFLKVDLPTILRRLKRSFGIDKDKE
ncbi:MAG TPA: hypothetical protein VFR24_09315 [Candidatus Angelobacter sp.]|nr:hypothetical protein [Candidatus Angelobacter sp.]